MNVLICWCAIVCVCVCEGGGDDEEHIFYYCSMLLFRRIDYLFLARTELIKASKQLDQWVARNNG